MYDIQCALHCSKNCILETIKKHFNWALEMREVRTRTKNDSLCLRRTFLAALRFVRWNKLNNVGFSERHLSCLQIQNSLLINKFRAFVSLEILCQCGMSIYLVMKWYWRREVEMLYLCVCFCLIWECRAHTSTWSYFNVESFCHRTT